MCRCVFFYLCVILFAHFLFLFDFINPVLPSVHDALNLNDTLISHGFCHSKIFDSFLDAILSWKIQILTHFASIFYLFNYISTEQLNWTELKHIFNISELITVILNCCLLISISKSCLHPHLLVFLFNHLITNYFFLLNSVISYCVLDITNGTLELWIMLLFTKEGWLLFLEAVQLLADHTNTVRVWF